MGVFVGGEIGDRNDLRLNPNETVLAKGLSSLVRPRPRREGV